MKRKELLSKAKRIVIKVGTRVITHHDGTLDPEQIEKLTAQVAALRQQNRQVVIVTSGAIGAGMAQLGLARRPQNLSQLQGCAAVGQSELMHTYAAALKKKGFLVAQILLTTEDLRSRARHLNARNTIFSLLEKGVIPVVNENDTVAVEEIKFGDNDRLSALVTNLVQADLLLILTDVDGLYQPLSDGQVKHIDCVTKITKEVEGWCGGRGTDLSTGGMATKLDAVKIVTRTGEGAIIANGRKEKVIVDILLAEAELGTYFAPAGGKLASKKRWLAFFTKPHGTIIVDEGARTALEDKGRSLLASGIVGVEGSFKLGEVVAVSDQQGEEFARGLVNYSSEEIVKIKGLKTSELQKVLQSKTYDEVIHRNNIVIL